MSDNQLIKRQQKELESIDKQTLPDTLNASEWQTLLLSGFLNEYSIAQVDANIDEIKKRITEIEERKYKKTSLNDKLVLSFKASLKCFAIIPILLIVGLVGALLQAIFKDLFIVKILEMILYVFINYFSLPLRFIFNIMPIKLDYNSLKMSTEILVILFSVLQLGILFGILAFYSLVLIDNDVEKQEKQKQKELEKVKKELDDYLPVANEIKGECNANLQEIYDQNLIPEVYHDYESLAMLYGYFACGAALNFQDAAKEYLQDKRTQAIVNVMEQTNEFLAMIANKIDILIRDKNGNNDKLNALIEQNNRSIEGKLLTNNPVSLIYSKAKNTLNKAFKR